MDYISQTPPLPTSIDITILPTATFEPTATQEPTATPEPTATIEPTPTQEPYHFGLEQGMTIEDCNKLVLNKDGTIPQKFVDELRKWVAENRPRFSDMQAWGYVGSVKGIPGFPLPLYRLPSGGRGAELPGPEQFIVSCSTVEGTPDTIVLGMVIKPHDFPDIANVNPENLPIIHVAITKSGTDWINSPDNILANYQLGGSLDGKFPTPSELLSILTDPAKLANITTFDVWTVVGVEKNDPDKIDAQLGRIMNYNSSYESPISPPGFPGISYFANDYIEFMFDDINKIEIGKLLSNRIIPALTIRIGFKQ